MGTVMPTAQTDRLENESAARRAEMVERQIARRGVRDPAVLRAVREVPRERFLPERLREFAYEDAPLPIAESQTISQPYVVALMAEALELQPTDTVLEIGAGSGYAAAILGGIAERVVTLERHASLAKAAAAVLDDLGYDNVEVHHADGAEGWPPRAPYEAIVVTAAAREIPPALLEQLAPGGRLVLPVGPEGGMQELRRISRDPGGELRIDELGPVQFVPLLPGTGPVGPWGLHRAAPAGRAASGASSVQAPTGDPVVDAVRREAVAFDSLDGADLRGLMERIGDARLVMIGEASHGTSEFYRMRQRITRELIERHAFAFVAAEADWPDAAVVDAYVRRGPAAPERVRQIFARFPTWMWRNVEVLEFVEWLRAHNDARSAAGQAKAAFYGLDLYSLYESIEVVLGYLDEVDPDAAAIARQRYGCLSPYESDPASYGLAAVSDRYAECEEEVLAMLTVLRERRGAYASGTGERFLDAEQNARVAANAERYYRAMYFGGAESWNLRDTHMFETLEALLAFHGREARGLVWAHNSHVGDAAQTEFAARGELSIGQLARQRFGPGARLVGFGTDHGTVAAAPGWGQPVEIMEVRPSHPRSHEHTCHRTELPGFLLPLRHDETSEAVHEGLEESRLERAMGVVYRPQTEMASHYFQARLARQFDEYIWFDGTSALTPLEGTGAPELAADHPFATLDR